MTPAPVKRATPADLMATEGKAELIGGKVVRFMASGDLPTEVAGNIYVSLRTYAKSNHTGRAKTDGTGYVVSRLPSGRESFEPDASYCSGNPPMTMGFIDGPPAFAAEVRGYYDYGKTPDREYAAKRIDYFAAGTLAVWDVDPLAETVTLYRYTDPLTPAVFQRGDVADAEPAVPGWRVKVDELFDV